MRRLFVLSALALLGLTSSARAEPAPVARPQPSLARPPTFAQPLLVRVQSGRINEPLWTPEGLWATRPRGLRGLARAEAAGPASWDPSSASWFASALGCLVRVEEGGALQVLAEGVQGADVDVRFAAGVAVSREPDHSIVLYSLREGTRRVLLRGSQYFRPRLSPDGRRVLLGESRPDGGRMLLLDLEGRRIDLGRGDAPAWLPDGRVVFTRLFGDGHVLDASEVWVLRPGSDPVRLAVTGRPLLTWPTPSPEGAHLALVDAHSRDLYVVAIPEER